MEKELSTNEIYEEAKEMTVGTSHDFTIDHDVVPGETRRLVANLCLAYPGEKGFSINRTGRTLSISCYVPPKND